MGGQKNKPGRYLTRNHNSTGHDYDDFSQLDRSLKKSGLYCKDIAGDGNCLFRALADQVDGTPNTHLRHREAVCDYMCRHPDEFSPFLDETCSFDRYVDNMRCQGVFGGNLELVAFARNYCVDIKVYQLGGTVFVISGGALVEEDGAAAAAAAARRSMPTVHIAYHSYEHYSSPTTTTTADFTSPDDDDNNSAAPTDIEKIVMGSTGVENHSLVRHLLKKHQHHSDSVIELLIQWMADESISTTTDADDLWWTKDGPPIYDGPQKAPEPARSPDEPAVSAKDSDETSVPDKIAESLVPDVKPVLSPQHKKGAARQKKAESKKRQKEMAKIKKRTAARQEAHHHHSASSPNANNSHDIEQGDAAANRMSHIYI